MEGAVSSQPAVLEQKKESRGPASCSTINDDDVEHVA